MTSKILSDDLVSMLCCSDDGPVVDEGAVCCADLQDWSQEFEYVTDRISSLFVHKKSRGHARAYLEGLLAPLERKNGWTIAEHAGEDEPKAMQRFLNLASWDAEGLRDITRDYVISNLAEPEAVLVADPTGFAKKGTKSAGVQRQYSGTLGRVDNCQIGTFLAYVNGAGDRVLIDRDLYIPRGWIDDPDRCAEAAIPPEVEFATRPAQVKAMIDRVRQAGLPFRWFTADEEFGQNPGLREHLETHHIAYVMAVPKNTEFTDAAGVVATVSTHGGKLRPHAWSRRACAIGAKGFRVYDWAVLDAADPDHQYMIRRSVDDGELAFYHCYNPRREPVGELARVAGTRWPIEECFQSQKSDIGLDNYQVRLYHAWYRHITLAMLAGAFLAVLAHRHRAKKGGPQPATSTTEPPPPTPRRPPTLRLPSPPADPARSTA